MEKGSGLPCVALGKLTQPMNTRRGNGDLMMVSSNVMKTITAGSGVKK